MYTRNTQVGRRPDPIQVIAALGGTERHDSKEGHRTRMFDFGGGKIGVTGELWFDNTAGVGGAGAIRLLMHTEDLDYAAAKARLLGLNLRGTAQPAREAKRADSSRKESVTAPTPDERRWCAVERYLTDQRGLPAHCIEPLHRRGWVYADERNNAVFPRQYGGAFVHGTCATRFVRTYGAANLGAYLIPGEPGGGVYVTEAPIDALSLKALHPRAQVYATGGNLVRPAALHPPAGEAIFAAQDADDPGEQLALETQRAFPRAQRARPPVGKDWNEYLQRCAVP